MPLTPQDVQNKVFSPTRFRTGYNEDEVDAFLDEVETELTRLLDENADLRRQLDEARRSGGGGGGGGAPTQLIDENAQLRRQLDDARRQVQMAQGRAAAQQERPGPQPPTGPTAVPTPQPAAARGPGRGEVDAEIEQRVARTLVLAQRTADEALREARADAERARREARADADRIIGEARAHVAEQLGTLEDDKRRLEGQVEQLRAFEREYRTRLRAYLEMQLRDLDGMPPTQPAVGAVAASRPIIGPGGPAGHGPGGGPGGPGAGPGGPRGGPGGGPGGPPGPGGPATAPFPAGASLGAPTGAQPAAHGPSPRPDADPSRRDGGPGLTDF